MTQAAITPEAFAKAAPRAKGDLRRAVDSMLIAVKELTQTANRASFQFEKTAFLILIAGTFIVGAWMETDGWTAGFGKMAGFGRKTFVPLSIFTCIALSASALASSTGIVMSETVGKRLDLLRITPLALESIVMGKALAVSARSLLTATLLLPILATMRLFGGVSAFDTVSAMAITVVNVIFVCALGVYISAGARSNIDRVVRTSEAVVLWLVATAVLGAGIAALASLYGAGAAGAALGSSTSPITIWMLLVQSKLPWPGLVIYSGVHVLSSYLLIRRAAKRLEATAMRADVPMAKPGQESILAAEDPNIQHLVSGFSRSGGRSKKLKQVAAERRWAGTLVGSQLLHTSLVAVLLPLAVGLPQLAIFFLSAVTGRHAYDWRTSYPAVVSVSMGAAVVLMGLIQSASLLAREKSRRTAELLALTPSGDASMLWWKGAAVGLSQSLAIVVVISMLIVGNLNGRYGFLPLALNLTGLVSLLALVYAAGVSFSLSSKSPYEAFGLLVASTAILTPVASWVLSWLIGYYVAGSPVGLGGARAVRSVAVQFGIFAMVPGLAMLALRNAVPRFGRAFLCGGLALCLAAASLAIPYEDRDTSPLMVPFLPLMNVLSERHFTLGASMFWCIGTEVLMAAALLAGCFVNFTGSFLFGSRGKE